jgi:hypothetical protein
MEALSTEILLTNSTCLNKFNELKRKHNRYSFFFLHVSALTGWSFVGKERVSIYLLFSAWNFDQISWIWQYVTYNIKIGDEVPSFTAKSSLCSHHCESVPLIFKRIIYIQQLTVSPRHSFLYILKLFQNCPFRPFSTSKYTIYYTNYMHS